MTKKETLHDSPPAPALPRGMGPSPSSPSIKGSLVLKFRVPAQGLWPFRFPFLDFFSLHLFHTILSTDVMSREVWKAKDSEQGRFSAELSGRFSSCPHWQHDGH